MARKRQKAVRLIKKIRLEAGRRQFVTIPRSGNRYLWDPRPGTYFLEWWEGNQRKRETAGVAPSEALETLHRKRLELAGALALGQQGQPRDTGQPLTAGTPIPEAAEAFLTHVRVHSPDKPATLKRYRAVIEHFERLLAGRRYIEAITRADIERYKALRLGETARGKRVRAATVNFEVSVLRTRFNFLRRELGLAIDNPCANFKPLRDAASKANRPPDVYSEDELAQLLAAAEGEDYAAYLTLALTGLREQELCWLTWDDVCLELGVSQQQR